MNRNEIVVIAFSFIILLSVTGNAFKFISPSSSTNQNTLDQPTFTPFNGEDDDDDHDSGGDDFGGDDDHDGGGDDDD